MANLQTLQQDIGAVPDAIARAQEALAGLEGTTCALDAGPLEAITAPLGNVGSAVDEVQGRLGRVKPEDLRIGVATMNRHFELSGDVPCTKKGKDISFGPKEVAVKVPVPQIGLCPFKLQVPMPNEHIPYIPIIGGRA